MFLGDSAPLIFDREAARIAVSREMVDRHLPSKTSTLVKCCSSNGIRDSFALNTRSIKSRNFRSVRTSSQKASSLLAGFAKPRNVSSRISHRCTAAGVLTRALDSILMVRIKGREGGEVM